MGETHCPFTSEMSRLGLTPPLPDRKTRRFRKSSSALIFSFMSYGKDVMEPQTPKDVQDVPPGTEGTVNLAPRRTGVAAYAFTVAAPDLVFRVNGDGTCLDLKASNELKSAVAAGGFVGKKLRDVLPAEVARKAMHLVNRTLGTGEVHAVEFQLPVHDDLREYEARLIPSGENEVVALVHEASKSTRLDEQVLHSQKMEAVGHLAGGVAHDFNNLLTAIMGYCQLGIQPGAHHDRTSDALLEIQKAAERGAGLCRQLLVFSSGPPVEPKVVSLNDLLSNLGTLLRRLIGENIELVTLPASDLGPVRVDPGQFEQVLVNLAVNAQDAMPDGGRLTIETANVPVDEKSSLAAAGADPGEYVMLAVTDTGVGIPASVKPHIFEPFFTTKEPGQGAGLGLFTCYGLISQSNGYIVVRSEQGNGTTFEVYLPRTEGLDASTTPGQQSGLLPRGRETVLLVEDEQVVREVASNVLRDQGYTVIEAAGSLEALGLAQGRSGQRVDLLFTDIVMPVMSGSELAHRLAETQPDIRILFTSGYAGYPTADARLQRRGSGFIEKPFTPAQLARKVRAVLES